MKISFVVPGRNNLKYFKWSYDSIQKNKGNHDVTICFADDASTDETWEWIQSQMAIDSNLKAIKNEGPDRIGHTILYDRIVNELVKTDLAMIWHCDMYLCPGALDAIEKQMYGEKLTEDERGILFRGSAMGPKLGFDIVDGKPVPPKKTPTEHYNEYNVPTHKQNKKTICSLKVYLHLGHSGLVVSHQ